MLARFFIIAALVILPTASGWWLLAGVSDAADPAQITLQLSPSSIPANGTSTSTATATVTNSGVPALTETVTFTSTDPNEKVSPTTNNANGTYSATITSSTTPGQATISATDLATHTSAQATLTQTATGSSTTLDASPSAPVTNEGVTLFAAVTASPTPSSGTITFDNGSKPINGCLSQPISSSDPTATCQTSFAAATSPDTLTAIYTPGAGSAVAGSTGVHILSVAKDTTSSSLTVSKASVNVGASETYTATVTPGHAGPVAASGSVEFVDGTTPISSCANQPLTQQSGSMAATCTVSYTQASTHSITALYRGDANFLASTSPPQSVSVGPGRVLGTISSAMHWTFYFTPNYTTVLDLRVQGAPIGAKVAVTCTGKGCPFVTRTTAVAKPKTCQSQGKEKCSSHDSETVHLQPGFGQHHLHVGARITVEVVRPGWIGKYYSFTVRSRRGPSIDIDCLPPGGTRPGIGC